MTYVSRFLTRIYLLSSPSSLFGIPWSCGSVVLLFFGNVLFFLILSLHPLWVLTLRVFTQDSWPKTPMKLLQNFGGQSLNFSIQLNNPVRICLLWLTSPNGGLFYKKWKSKDCLFSLFPCPLSEKLSFWIVFYQKNLAFRYILNSCRGPCPSHKLNPVTS